MVTSTMNTISARIAFSLISSPQDGPTSLSTTSSTEAPVRSASAPDTWSDSSALSGSASTRNSRPSSLSSSVIVAPARPNWSTASRASPTEASPAGASHTTPPSKSMPRLRPRVANDTRLMATATSEIANHRRRRPTKSIVVSPW